MGCFGEVKRYNQSVKWKPEKKLPFGILYCCNQVSTYFRGRKPEQDFQCFHWLLNSWLSNQNTLNRGQSKRSDMLKEEENEWVSQLSDRKRKSCSRNSEEVIHQANTAAVYSYFISILEGGKYWQRCMSCQSCVHGNTCFLFIVFLLLFLSCLLNKINRNSSKQTPNRLQGLILSLHYSSSFFLLTIP